MRIRVAALAAVHAVLAAGLLLAPGAGLVAAPRALCLAVALVFGLVGSLTVHIELRRHACAVTVVEAVLVAAMFHLEPLEVVVAATVGEALACVLRRQPLLQLSFNVTSVAATSTVAVAAFAAGGRTDPSDAVAWAAALGAALLCGVVGHGSTSAVLAIVERRRFAEIFAASITAATVATGVSGTLGLLGVVLLSINPVALLLVAPLVVLMVVETRRLATHRAEHLRFERLYEASGRTAGLTSQVDAMTTLANEARSLVTGVAAICCSVDAAGCWQGVVVDDNGGRAASPEEVDAACRAVHGQSSVELTASDLPGPLRRLAAPLESLVVATTKEHAAAPVVLGVARQLPNDRGSRARAEVLGAFISHAALCIANAKLFVDVEAALAHQLDLNRQKDDFVAAVSHELRTPLTSMIGSMDSMRRFDDRLTPEKRAVLVDIALRQGGRLKQLIEDLLLLSTIEASPRDAIAKASATVDLQAVVAEIAECLGVARHDAPAVAIGFETTIVPELDTDEGKVRQILTNLVENARKYAPESPITIRAEGADDVVAIHVIDAGAGIQCEDRERVFERFVQLDQSATRARGGTGLGLYLCRQLALTLGGTLTLAGNATNGCCFTLTLPGTVTPLSGDDRARPLELPLAMPAVLIGAS